MPKAIKGPDLGSRTAAAIAAEIAALDAAAAPRAVVLAECHARRAALIETGTVAQIEALDAEIRRAAIAAEQDGARRGRLTAEHAATVEAEARAAEQTRRRAAYDEASAAANEVGRLYREAYPRLAQELAALLAHGAMAREKVRLANLALPEGEQPIDGTFEPNRGRPWIEGRHEPTKTLIRYRRDTGAQVYQWTPGDPNVVEEWVPNGTTYVPASPGTPHVPLQAAVHLPGLAFGDTPFWPPHPQAAALPIPSAASSAR